ncbi:unnamed protein product [Gongylonema pulchrum]|uniref:Transmembrane protein n=1 Tax=Gongylonema pulchrum TaxID=637853 RepID=A0A183D504_9BILA|nr:unnamed protein product [Gongylonema pulchrum]
MLYLAQRYQTMILAVVASSFSASIVFTFYKVLTFNLPPTLMLTAESIS